MINRKSRTDLPNHFGSSIHSGELYRGVIAVQDSPITTSKSGPILVGTSSSLNQYRTLKIIIGRLAMSRSWTMRYNWTESERVHSRRRIRRLRKTCLELTKKCAIRAVGRASDSLVSTEVQFGRVHPHQGSEFRGRERYLQDTSRSTKIAAARKFDQLVVRVLD